MVIATAPSSLMPPHSAIYQVSVRTRVLCNHHYQMASCANNDQLAVYSTLTVPMSGSQDMASF